MTQIYVHIIESPSADDIFGGDYEGHILTQALRLIRINSQYYLTVNESNFNKAIGQLHYEITENKKIPFLHISAHGNKDGIALTDKTFITWDTLKSILMPINDEMHGMLCGCIASCDGYNGYKMAIGSSQKTSFFALIGPTKKIPLTDMAIGFASYYHNFFLKDKSGKYAVNAMKIASGNPNFDIMLSQEAKNIIDDYKKILQEKQNLK